MLSLDPPWPWALLLPHPLLSCVLQVWHDGIQQLAARRKRARANPATSAALDTHLHPLQAALSHTTDAARHACKQLHDALQEGSKAADGQQQAAVAGAAAAVAAEGVPGGSAAPLWNWQPSQVFQAEEGVGRVAREQQGLMQLLATSCRQLQGRLP